MECWSASRDGLLDCWIIGLLEPGRPFAGASVLRCSGDSVFRFCAERLTDSLFSVLLFILFFFLLGRRRVALALKNQGGSEMAETDTLEAADGT